MFHVSIVQVYCSTYYLVESYLEVDHNMVFLIRSLDCEWFNSVTGVKLFNDSFLFV